jgi:hypothetical protein
MRIVSGWPRKQIACSLVMMLTAPITESAVALPLKAAGDKQPQSASSVSDQSGDSSRPVGNSTSEAKRPDEAYPDNPDPVRSEITDQDVQSGTSQPSAQQGQDGAPKPVGTAAAPYEKTTGVAASRPAGAVIAPAKQRRARAFLIRVSVVVGAAVAIGTVLALTHGSPSRPN